MKSVRPLPPENINNGDIDYIIDRSVDISFASWDTLTGPQKDEDDI